MKSPSPSATASSTTAAVATLATATTATVSSRREQASRRSLLRSGGALIVSTVALPGILRAESMPATLRLICTAPPGSIPDIVARRYGEQLAGHYARNVVIDNKVGAAGQIAVSALKQAPADGQTALLAQGAIATIYPYLYDKLQYDPATDLRSVSVASEMTLALAIGPAVPAGVVDLKQFITWARSNPRLVNAGSPGTGTLPHLLEALLFREAGLQWEHVPYQGGPPAIVNLIGGQIACLALPEGLLRQHQQTGKLRILATSGSTRTSYLPDVPTFVEQGFKSLVIREWFSFFMPGHTPNAIIDRLAAAVRDAGSKPALANGFSEVAMSPLTSTPAQLAARIIAEQRVWQPLLKATGIRAG